jgi:hypothetical protein
MDASHSASTQKRRIKYQMDELLGSFLLEK